MNTEYEKLRAAHLAYKGVTVKERAAFRNEITELKEVLKAASAPDMEQIKELKAKNAILKQLITVVTNQLDDKQMIINLLTEKRNA